MANQLQLRRAKVAIITRTKDRGLLLERAIKSVHQQTMTDFIHVIINDAGDPNIVDDLVEKYKDVIKGRVKVIHNQTSRGMEAASNKAIKSVDSELIAIHDDDDTWHPDCLRQAISHMEAEGAVGVVVTTDRITERIVGNAIHLIWTDRWLPDARSISLYKMCLDNYMTPITFLYKRAVFDVIGYYDESLLVCGDWDFGLRFIAKYDVAFLDTPYALAYYHHRPDARGINGNSVHAGYDKHQYFVGLLANKYLREDMTRGGLGLGYLFNALRDQREAVTRQKQEQEKTINAFHESNQRIEASLQRLENLVFETTSPKRVIRGAARFAKRLPHRIAGKALRSVGVTEKRV